MWSETILNSRRKGDPGTKHACAGWSVPHTQYWRWNKGLSFYWEKRVGFTCIIGWAIFACPLGILSDQGPAPEVAAVRKHSKDHFSPFHAFLLCKRQTTVKPVIGELCFKSAVYVSWYYVQRVSCTWSEWVCLHTS